MQIHSRCKMQCYHTELIAFPRHLDLFCVLAQTTGNLIPLVQLALNASYQGANFAETQ